MGKHVKKEQKRLRIQLCVFRKGLIRGCEGETRKEDQLAVEGILQYPEAERLYEVPDTL